MSIIMLVEPELESQRDVALAPTIQAPTAPAPNFMFNLGQWQHCFVGIVKGSLISIEPNLKELFILLMF
jgi:hypothetical protein